jgi:hypothetical protein
MSLQTYKEAKPWLEEMLQRVSSRQMPPWHAVPGEIEFANDRHLSDREIETITSWVSQGGKERDPKDLPPPPDFSMGLQTSQPDVLFSMEKDYTLEAGLRDHYLYFRIPTAFKQDKWIQAVEFRVGNPKVVHHAVAYIETPEEQRLNSANSGRSKVWSLLDTQLPSIELMTVQREGSNLTHQS